MTCILQRLQSPTEGKQVEDAVSRMMHIVRIPVTAQSQLPPLVETDFECVTSIKLTLKAPVLYYSKGCMLVFVLCPYLLYYRIFTIKNSFLNEHAQRKGPHVERQR